MATETKKFTLVQHSISRGFIASIHKEGCKHIKKDRQQHGGPTQEMTAKSGVDAVARYVDKELQEMGYTVDDVNVCPCAK